MSQRYCIIGAGFCGLGVAKALRDYGIPFDCFERNEDVGGNWLNGVYDSTHIISSRDSTQYADFPMPAEYPDFPSASQILAYLRSYADRFSLRGHIHFSTEVSSITPVDPSGMTGWNVRLANGEERRYTGVIVANGHHWDKRIPNYPGTFTGKALHSKDYKNPSDFAGKRVLVVGAGNSGCDIAVEAALNGLESHVSMRRGYYFLPKTIFGVPTAEVDRPWLPFAAQKMIAKAAIRLSAGPNTKYGLLEPDHEIFDHHPIVNSQLLYFIRHGKVKPKRDIERFEGQVVHFKDGTQMEVDTIVWATGFNITFPFLDHGLFGWENGVPKRVAGFLPEKIAGLYVYGLSQPRGGAGPLITASSKLLAEMILTQQKLDYPISVDLAKVAPASARMLVGVSSSLREIRAARKYIKWLELRFGKTRVSAAASRPRPRNLKLDFDSGIPKYWMFESALASHMANALNLLFPSGERFFIRSVNPYLASIQDPELKKRAQAFIAQEVQHGREHEKYFDVLRAQGFKFDGYLKAYERVAYSWIESVLSPKMRLAVTAAVEHYTAAFAEDALLSWIHKPGVHPTMSDLFSWHAAEEIEHKSVAFDVLQSVAPGYFRRAAGMLIATMTLGGFWVLGIRTLWKQDPDATFSRLVRELTSGVVPASMARGTMLKACLEYFVPGFHPEHVANHGLAEDALHQLGEKYVL